MQNILFFTNFFWSSSINFKAERLWILRLVYAGLNFDEDAQIYMNNSVLEALMSFYVSPISDDESKELMLQVTFLLRKQLILQGTCKLAVISGVCFCPYFCIDFLCFISETISFLKNKKCSWFDIVGRKEIKRSFLSSILSSSLSEFFSQKSKLKWRSCHHLKLFFCLFLLGQEWVH